jgi:1-acyl-sn-glycerol-3-phosphate acyltransferase
MLRIWINFIKGVMMVAACSVESFFYSDIHRQSAIFRKWAGRLLRAAGVPYTVRGLEHLEGLPPAILVSNHGSSVDIPLIYAAVPRSLRMIAKVELLKVPFLGWILRRGRFVTVHRRHHDKAMQELHGVEWLFAHGADLCVAAEGTRTLDGALRPFKKGAFVLAIQHQVPIVPITLVNTFTSMPKHALAPTPGIPVVCVIHPAVYPTGLTYEDREALLDKVRNIIQSGLEGPPPSAPGADSGASRGPLS